MAHWPITLDDVRAARERLRPHLPPTPLRAYAPLDEAVGRGDPRAASSTRTSSRPAPSRCGTASRRSPRSRPSERERGVVAATRGNHGLGPRVGGRAARRAGHGVRPVGNNPEKNAAVRGLGARLVEEGRDYDESVAAAERLVREAGLHLVHSTNDADRGRGRRHAHARDARGGARDRRARLLGRRRLAGGRRAHRGARAAARARRSTACRPRAPPRSTTRGTRAGRSRSRSADTFADGLATRNTYALTFEALREGLAGFVTVTDAEIAEAVRLVLCDHPHPRRGRRAPPASPAS